MMGRWRVLLCLAACLGSAHAARSAEAAQASPTARAVLAGIAVDEPLDRESILLAALPRSTAELPPLRARVSFDLAGTRTSDLAALLADLDRRLNAYVARRVSIVLSLGAFPAADDQVETWRQSLRAVAAR